jgi:hypothetical protein
MPSVTAAPSGRRSLDAALAGLDALASELERAAEARPVAGGRRAAPVLRVEAPGRVAPPERPRPSAAREVLRFLLHGAGALLLVSAVLGLAGWVVMVVLPAPPRPAVAGVADASAPIHPLVPPAP